MTWYSEFIKRIRRRKIRMSVQPIGARRPHDIAEKDSNSYGVGTLTYDEVARFYAAVKFIQSAILQEFGAEWVHHPYSGEDYVLTEYRDRKPDRPGSYFSGYEGIREVDNGYVLMNCDERYTEAPTIICARFEDALKAYAAEAVSEIRGHGRSGLGPVAWMWGGHPGPDVDVKTAEPRRWEYRFFLREDPEVWIEGSTTAAGLSHGLSMSFEQFFWTIIDHPKTDGEHVREVWDSFR